MKVQPIYSAIEEAKPVSPEASEIAELPAVSIGELMGLTLKERARLLPWLPEGGHIMVYGPRGIGKTYFALSLAISLATGETFLKWEPIKAVGVLIVDGEMALTELRDRLRSLLPGTPTAPLEILSHEYVYSKYEQDLNLGRKEWQELIKSYLDDHPEIRVVLLDNLSCLFPDVPEDTRDDWTTKVLPFVTWLKRRGISAVYIHHSGKGGKQRGTSAREDSLDTVIALRPVPDHDATHGAQFVITFEKSRLVSGDDVASIEARFETDHDGVPQWTVKSIEESNKIRLLNLVRDGIDSVTDAADELGISKGQISKLKKKLREEGLLKSGVKMVLANE